MKHHVADASVAVKWFVPEAVDEANVDQAMRLLMAGKRQEAQFLQPPHWVGEIAADRKYYQKASTLGCIMMLEDFCG